MIRDAIKKNNITNYIVVLGVLLYFVISFLFITNINLNVIIIGSVIIIAYACFFSGKINNKFDIFHPVVIFGIIYTYSIISNYITFVYLPITTDAKYMNQLYFPQTVIYCFLCFLGFVLTSLILSLFFNRKGNIKEPELITQDALARNKNLSRGILKILEMFTFVFLAIVYVILILNWDKYVNGAYGAFHHYSSDPVSLLFSTAYFWNYLISTAYLVAGTIYNKKIFTVKSSTVVILLVLFGILNSIKTVIIQTLFVLLFCYTLKIILGYIKPKIKILKTIIAVMLSLLVFMFFIMYTFLSRNIGERGIGMTQVIAMRESLADSYVQQALFAHFFSLYPTFAVDSNIMYVMALDNDFKYGYTYYEAIMKILPRFVRPASFDEESTIQLLYEDSLAKIKFGGGFSMEADAYINFGMYGFVFFIVWGAFLTYLYYQYRAAPYQPWRSFCYAICMVASLMSIREPFYILFKILVYGIVLSSLMELFYLYSINKIKLIWGK